MALRNHNLDHRSNVLQHAQDLPRQSAIKHPSSRTIGSHPGTPENRAPMIDDLCSASEMLECMSKMTVGARNLGQAADLLTHMFQHSDFTVLTMSGAASMGQLDLIIAELLDRGYIHAIVCTGAIVTHGTSLEMGHKHFQAIEEDVDEETDVALYNRGYNRVFDTIELEKALDESGDLLIKLLKSCDEECLGSYEVHEILGEELCKRYPDEDGILHAAHRASIPVFVPAFTDSELGLSYARYLCEGGKVIYDAFRDLDKYTEIYRACDCPSILTLGGGVPRNWAQQVAPFLDTLIDRKVIKDKPKRFKYGVRICPEFTEWGGLSGCTYSEGMSWGKFVPKNQGGEYAEVYADYTAVFPLLIKGVMERLDGEGSQEDV